MANKKVVYVVIALIAIVIVALAANYYYATPTTGSTTVYKYDTGLSVNLKVNNIATSSLVTDNAKVQFFPLGTDPVGTKTFKDAPTDQATYSATAGAWQAQLDAGSYVCLVYSTNSAFLPKTFTVNIPGTNDDGKTVWATPGTLSVSTLADSTGDADTPTIKAIADETGAALTPVTTAEINVANASEWKLTYTINISDPGSAPDAVLPDSIFYMPSSISGLSVVSATVNGEDATVTQNTESASGPVG
ncbi:Uncharacterised protein [uncultured archaeon]|nr:Uncharacterised protein [uncultured archaeon]